MAGLESIIARILEDARLKASENINKARTEAEAIIAEAKAQAQASRKLMLGKAALDAEAKAGRLVSSAGLQGRKTMLETKQKRIDQVFSNAAEALVHLPQEDYINLLEAMIQKSVGNSDAEIILSERDRDKIGAAVVEKANLTLSKSDKSARVALADQTGDFSGGVKVKTGKILVNNSVEAVIKQLRSQLEPEIVKILFGQDNPSTAGR